MTGQASANRAPRQQLLPMVAAGFVTSLVVANIIAVKLFQAGPFVLPAAIIIFPLSYIFGDILTEVYGYARARQVIWTGFACNLLAVAAIWTSIRLQPACLEEKAILNAAAVHPINPKTYRKRHFFRILLT